MQEEDYHETDSITVNLNNHPTVIAYRQTAKKVMQNNPTREWVKKIICEAGADDAGVVEIDSLEIEGQKKSILTAFPRAETLVSFICRMNPDQIQSQDHTLADGEFIAVDAEMRLIARKAAKVLRENGIAVVTPSENFPQDMNKWTGKMATISHKPVAAAAGLGHIGHHRLLIHPVFGSHICLGTMVLDAPLDSYDRPLEFNPCISCKLCISVCPTGAICRDGSFKFKNCLIHAYRDRLGGFLNWIEAMVSSKDMDEYRTKRKDSETMAIWQSLTYGGGYRCGYCMSVCPAGTELIGPYLDNRKDYIQSIVKPLLEKKESVYIFPGHENEDSLHKRFPNKTAIFI
jgi:epoxyqueuosine reductase QueG